MDPAAIPFLLFKLSLFGLVVWAWRVAERDVKRLRARQAEERRAESARPAPAASDPPRQPARETARKTARKTERETEPETEPVA